MTMPELLDLMKAAGIDSTGMEDRISAALTKIMNFATSIRDTK